VARTPTGRRAAATRNFSVGDLDALPRENRRQLCQLLLAESGLRILGGDQRADYDQFLVEVSPMWRPRRGSVRVVYRPLTQEDIDDVEQLARDKGFADALLVEASGGAIAVNQLRSNRVHIIGAPELVERLEAAALIAWQDDRPTPDLDQYGLLREVDRLLPALDPVGLRWLVTLSLNKLPQELGHLGQPPDRLFERVVFRIFTSVFRFGGMRLGARASGTPAPDSILRRPTGASVPFSALTDCKAARDGYVMDINAERALRDYVRDYREAAEANGDPLRYLVVVSSSFPAGRQPHPYRLRARRLREQTSTELVYLRAADLLVLAVAVERDEASPSVRVAIDWARIFDDGLVKRETLLSTYNAAKES
jgi:hypothetical protein